MNINPIQSPPRILVVEDDEDHGILISHAFNSDRSHAELSVVKSLRAARAHLTRSTVDLVIADIRLPDGKGKELLESPEDTRNYPVVIMTSFGNEELAVECIKSGALDYIVKTEDSFRRMPRVAERAIREWRNITARQQFLSLAIRQANVRGARSYPPRYPAAANGRTCCVERDQNDTKIADDSSGDADNLGSRYRQSTRL